MEGNNEALLKALTVETLRIYNYFLKRNPNEVTLDEVAKHFKLTKPTILHHLDKLKRVDLIEQTTNGYKVRGVVRVAIIKGYTNRIRQLLSIWLPITVIFAILLGVSLFMIEPIGMKAFSVLLALTGLGISGYKILKMD